MAFEVNQYVFHRHCGICLVQALAPLPGMNNGVLYYVLSPLFGDDKGSIVRVPVDGASSLGTPIDKDQAMDLIANWPSPKKDIYIADSKLRKQSYESALKEGNLIALIPLLQGALQRKARDGHLNSMDSQFVNRAAPLVYGSISLALDINYDDVSRFIADHVA